MKFILSCLKKYSCMVLVGMVLFVLNSFQPTVYANNEQWRLPFTAGTRLHLDQAYLGLFSHQGRYALDIQGDNMEISASKSGTIIALRHGGKWDQWCNSNADCQNKGGIWRGNHIEISHGDGVVSYYFHIKGGSIPKHLGVGSYVKQGEIIGRMGHVGYSCSLLHPICTVPDPHLHFEVTQNGRSIPTVFEDCQYHGNECVNGAPVAWKHYTSINTDPNQLRQISGHKLRLKESGFGLKLAQNRRGTTVNIALASESDSFFFSGDSFRGPQNWCLEAIMNNGQPIEGGGVFSNECNNNAGQKWRQFPEGDIFLQGTNFCLAPLHNYKNESFNTQVVVKNCINSPMRFKWGGVGVFDPNPVACFNLFRYGGECKSRSHTSNQTKPEMFVKFEEQGSEDGEVEIGEFRHIDENPDQNLQANDSEVIDGDVITSSDYVIELRFEL